MTTTIRERIPNLNDLLSLKSVLKQSDFVQCTNRKCGTWVGPEDVIEIKGSHDRFCFECFNDKFVKPYERDFSDA